MFIIFFSIFIISLITDGVILPAFWGFKNSIFSILFLVILILYTGSSPRHVLYGLFFCVILELSKGLNWGVVSIPFLLTVFVIHVAQILLDIKYTYETRLNAVKLIATGFVSVLFTYLFMLLFQLSEAVTNNGGIIFFKGNYFLSPATVATTVLEAVFMVLVFNLVFNKKNNYA